MTKIIAIANQKGGVGKTTSTIELASGLIKKGQRVLVIDMDPQASLTLAYGHDHRVLEQEKRTLYFALMGEKDLSEIIIEGEPSLIPSSIHLATAEPELVAEWDSTSVLKDKLKSLREESRFDYILLDCPPTLTLLTINALSTADQVLIPVSTNYLSIMGIQLLLETVEKIQTKANPTLKIFGILPTMYDKRNSHDKEALELLTTSLGPKIRVFEAINRSTGFAKSVTEGKATLDFLPRTPGAQNYQLLADNLINQNG